MSDPEQTNRSGNHYRNISINDGARAHLGDAYYSSQEDPLSRLPLATNAYFNSFERQHEPACLPNTRVNLLQEIYNWADRKDGQDERCIFWLNGLAGTGKSTISRTVAHEYNKQKRLGASFFFSKGGGDAGHAGKFFTTLAAQLAFNISSLRQSIREAARNRSDIASLSLSEQWRQLVLRPLSNLHSETCQSHVLVVDALDECENDKDVQTILHLLAEARSLTTVRLRIFLTSRPETPIRHSLHLIPQTERRDFILHSIPATIVNHDITIFLQVNFEQIRNELYLEAEWPGTEVIERLAIAAGSLFIWAATACRFVREGRKFAEDRLSVILKDSLVYTSAADSSIDDSSTDGTENEDLAIAPDEQLNGMYNTVLEYAASKYPKDERKKLYKEMRRTLGGLIILFSPLPAKSLASLLNLQEKSVFQTLDDLHSILDIQNDPTRPLRLHHPSFRDFLLTKDKCNKHFYVDERRLHRILADGCIQLMSQTLKEDICEMHTPGSQVSRVESSRIQKYLPPEVQYACLYWAQHLQKTESQVCDGDEAHRFLQVHLLHWLEALGWMGKTSEGIQAILSLEGYILASESPNLYAFIHDAKRFALHNRFAIEQTPLQLYCSALIFAPEKSIVRRQFESCIPKWIQKKSKVQENWSATLQTLEGHSNSVTSVAFSPDGKQVVSGSDDRTVRLWDVATGALQQTLEGHSGWVSSVAFSPDSKQVVSGSADKTVRLWDVATGALQQTLKGHSGSVSSVAFSPDSKQVVSGSADKTVRLWDVATGALQQTLKGHSGWVNSVAFSPDGKQVVSGSADKAVRLWDVATGALQQTLEGHSGWVSSVAFSPDSKQVVSGSADKTVRLWDVATGALQQTLKGHFARVNSVAFSPDSKQVVSGSDDETMRLWDVATGALQQTLEGHSGWVSSVAFSPDSKQVVSGSADKTVRLWDVATGALQQTLKGHSARVNSVAFSPHGKVLPILRVSDTWLAEDNINFLWLPTDYRPTCNAVRDKLVILGHSSGRITILQIRKGSKFV